MMTRIDKLLGKEIFERIQDSLPRDIDIMVGISDTSGNLVTGKRNYETCYVCRELINPCLRREKRKPYSCLVDGIKCELFDSCRGGIGNSLCTKSDKDNGEEAIRTNMTVLYRCFFGLANYAIPVPIAELGSIILYGGQFTVRPLKKENEILIEEYDEKGNKILICEANFRKTVLAAVRWRKNQTDAKPHLSNKERDALLSEYIHDKNVPEQTKNIEVEIEESATASDGKRQLKCLEWPLHKLESLLRGRYNLSVFEAWDDFLNPPEKGEISEKSDQLTSFNLAERLPHSDYEVRRAAKHALTKFRAEVEAFFDPEKQENLSDEYQKAIIPLRKALSTIELLKELAILISRTANVVFYKDTYLMLKRIWNNHPISTVESCNDKWQECETLLHQLHTSGGKEFGSPKGSELEENPEHLKLVGELTRSLMLFAYKLLFDDFRSVIAMLRYNYRLAKDYGQLGTSGLIEHTEVCFSNIKTAACVFIRDLLENEYDQIVREARLADNEHRERLLLEEVDNDLMFIRGFQSDSVSRIRTRLEEYYEREETDLSKSLETDEKLDRIAEWKNRLLELLEKSFDDESLSKRISSGNIMLRNFYLIFAGDQEEKLEDELNRIEVNLRWADTEIRNQVENVSTSVLQFDVCQSFLQFIGRLREFVYTERFTILEKLAKESKEFEDRFMNEVHMTCKYFINHGIVHVKKVLENVNTLLALAEEGYGRENGNIETACHSPIWEYYVRCAALFHDVGMFSEQLRESIYGGPAAVRRCHGAFSGKRIVGEKAFALLGNEQDRRIIAQICAFHQGSANIDSRDERIRMLTCILRIADELDIGENRVSGLNERIRARNEWRQSHILSLKKLIVESRETKDRTDLQVPDISVSTSDVETQAKLVEKQIQAFAKLEEKILAIAEKEEGTSVWPKGACFEFVNKSSTAEIESSNLTQMLKHCSEIRAILETVFHYQKHISIKNIELALFSEEDSKGKRVNTYLKPVIALTDRNRRSYADFIFTREYQAKIVAKVKKKLMKELDSVKPFLEAAGIRFKNPRISRNSAERNLLFINAPIGSGKMKFKGAPTSLMYAIAPISDMIDSDHNYMDVNIEIWDPICFEEREQQELRSILRDLNPRIIGISNTSAGHSTALEIVKIIREIQPQAIVIFGGSHENVLFNTTIEKHHKFIDISIGGVEEPLNEQTNENTKHHNNNECCANRSYRADAEYILLEIVKSVLDKNLSRDNLPQIMEDLPYKDLEGKFRLCYYDGQEPVVKISGNRDLVLDGLPIIPRHLLERSEKYNYEIFRNEITGKARKTAQVITTRGCMHRCVFCSSVGKSARRMYEDVMKELRQLKTQGYEAIFFDDSTFADECGNKPTKGYECPYTLDFCPKVMPEKEWNNPNDDKETKKRKEGYVHGECGYAIKICKEMIRENMGFTWGCQTRVDVIHDKLLNKMKSAGCSYVYFGVESLDQGILRKMCKKITFERIVEGIRLSRSKGIDIGISLVFGLEGEDKKTCKETIANLRKLLEEEEDQRSRVSCVSINVATVYPGTMLAERFEGKPSYAVADFDQPPRFLKYPYTEFEEAGWNVLPCCVVSAENEEDCIKKSEELAKIVLKECRNIIGEPLI